MRTSFILSRSNFGGKGALPKRYPIYPTIFFLHFGTYLLPPFPKLIHYV